MPGGSYNYNNMRNTPPDTRFKQPAGSRATFEYVNKNSARLWPALFFSVFLSLAFITGAFFYFKKLENWELNGGTIRMNSAEQLLYQLGGKWLNAGLVFFLGVFILIAGIRQWQTRRRLKDADVVQAPERIASAEECKAMLLAKVNRQYRTAVNMVKYVSSTALILALICWYPFFSAEGITGDLQTQARITLGILLLIAVLVPFVLWWSAGKNRQLVHYINHDPGQVVWVFTQRTTVNGVPSEAVVLGDHKGVLRRIPVNMRKGENGHLLLNAAAQVFPGALLGYSFERMKMYKRNPSGFTYAGV